MITHIKSGDLVWCQIPSWNDEENDTLHPSLVLEITENFVKVIPVTNSSTSDVNKIAYDVSLFTCCMALTGYVQITNKRLALSLCKFDSVCNCTLSLKLKLLLKRYGIKY